MKFNRQAAFSIFIGVIMITSVMGFAIGSNVKTQQDNVRIESVYDRLLTPQERISILRAGRVLIEYLHMGEFESVEKQATYENFVARFKDFVVLEVVEVEFSNQTLDQMISPDGDVIELGNVSSSELVDVFCQTTFVQPRECLMRSV